MIQTGKRYLPKPSSSRFEPGDRDWTGHGFFGWFIGKKLKLSLHSQAELARQNIDALKKQDDIETSS